MWQRVRRGGRLLGRSDGLLLAGAAVAQVAAACALRATGLRAARTAAMTLRPCIRVMLAGAEDRVLWAIEATGRRLRRGSTCLVRAVIVEARFASDRRPLRLEVGVRRTPEGALESHAWVTDAGRVLVGGPVDKDFVPMISWESAA